MKMSKIDLQVKTQVEAGTIEKYWFENSFIGLEKTLFHRIILPLRPFISGLEYEEQPVKTEFQIEWLDVGQPEDYHNLKISSSDFKNMEASIYLGYAHNYCIVEEMKFSLIELNTYRVDGGIYILFEQEEVGINEAFTFQSKVVLMTDEGPG